jgi:hypothetical protein
VGDAYLAALCRMDLSEIYLELNLSDDAVQMADESLAKFRRLGMGYETAKSLAYLAIAHGQQGKVLRALELCAEARALFIKEQNSVWPALLDLYQALILFGHRGCSKRAGIARPRWRPSDRRRWPASRSSAGCSSRAWPCAWASSRPPAGSAKPRARPSAPSICPP